MFIELVKGVALLLALCFLHGVNIRLWRRQPLTGQVFSGLIVTKLDGTAKGGVLAAIAQERPVPVYFIGVGEKLEDLETFNAREFAQALLT